jgi:two-component system, sensor histidine kinase
MAFSVFINGPPGAEEKESVLVCQLREANSNLVLAALNARKLQEGAELALLNEDRFLAILAHELRNPLTPISLAVKSLATLIDANAKLPRLQETLARQVKHLVYLVTSMDDMSRIESGKLLLDMQLLNPVDVVLAALEMAQPLADAHKQDLHVHLPAERILVRGDFDRLIEVFANLLTNATKFTPEGGTISLVMRHEGTSLLVSIQDNGKGVSAEFQPIMFDMFAQEGATQSHLQAGLGIGLSLVKTLVERHGGSVAVRSTPKVVGTTFIVTLPLAPNDASVEAPLALIRTV